MIIYLLNVMATSVINSKWSPAFEVPRDAERWVCNLLYNYTIKYKHS